MRLHWCVPSGWWQSYRLVSKVGDTESAMEAEGAYVLE